MPSQNLQINDRELELLIELVTDKAESLRNQMRQTDARAFKAGLGVDRTELESLRDNLREQQSARKAQSTRVAS